MKIVLTIVITIAVIAIVLYFMNKNKPVIQQKKQETKKDPYAGIGAALANLISNTKCGKNGNPPCTKDDLQQAGWSQEQISQAEAGSEAIKNWSLCYNFGINCG